MDFVKLQGVQVDEQRYNLIPGRKSTYIMDNQYREIVIYNPEMQLGAKKKTKKKTHQLVRPQRPSRLIRKHIIHRALMCWFGSKDIRKTITTVDNTLSRIFKMKQHRRWSKGNSFIIIYLWMVSKYSVRWWVSTAWTKWSSLRLVRWRQDSPAVQSSRQDLKRKVWLFKYFD